MDHKGIIKSELELSQWFIKNYKNLGYKKIVKDNKGRFPDFIMSKNNKNIRVELETLLSNFILHKHDLLNVDEIVCIEDDVKIPKKIIKIKKLKFSPRLKRLSVTVDPSTILIINKLLENTKYRNRSHLIEIAIEDMWEEIKREKSKK